MRRPFASILRCRRKDVGRAVAPGGKIAPERDGTRSHDLAGFSGANRRRALQTPTWNSESPVAGRDNIDQPHHHFRGRRRLRVTHGSRNRVGTKRQIL
jgi:hypothetical protein